MNREDAIITLTNTASLLRDGTRYMKPEHEKQFRESYEMAIKALEPCEETDKCEGCAFEDRKKWEGPCWRCKRNCKDYWRRKGEHE